MATPNSHDDVAPVVAFWRDLGLPGLIDVHTHFMPHRMLRKVWASFDSVTDDDGNGWPITYPSIDALEGLAHLDLGPDWLRAVCHDNAAALFGVRAD